MGERSPAHSFMNENEKTTEGLRRLPLWRTCLEELRARGQIRHGQTIDAHHLEKALDCDRNSIAFSFAVSNIRRELEEDGYYLSGRGQHGNQFVILPPASNADVMRAYAREAANALKRGVILGTNTRLDTLSEADRKRHESILERIATKAALLTRSQQIAKVLRKNNPKLLQG
jgi:hypothetical protein